MATQGAGGCHQSATAAAHHRPRRAGRGERGAVRQPLAGAGLPERRWQAAKVMPLGLAQQGPRLYLVCRFEDFDNERSLALHRIRKAQASTLSFERPKEFDLAQYDADGRFGFGYGEKVRLTFEIETEAGFHLTETPLSPDQDVQVLNAEWMQISATVVDSAMLEWWLRGFGEAVRNIRRTAIES